MSTTNIGGDTRDTSYRYKMPEMLTKVEGSGNGVKTVIVNMEEIAKALHCPASYPTKFLGIELGTQSKKKGERVIVNGFHTTKDMAKLLKKFIDNFILCPTCKLPEIKLVGRLVVKYECAACGGNGILPTKHKLSDYIIKSKKKKNGEEKKDNPVYQDVPEPKKKRVIPDDSGGSDEVEVVWFTDTSKDAQNRRKEQEFIEMSGGQNSTTPISECAQLGNKSESPSTILKIFMASATRSIQEVMSELKRLQISRGLNDHQKIGVLLGAIINVDEEKTIAQQYAANAKLLRNAIYIQDIGGGGRCLLNHIEEQVGVIHPSLLKKTCGILQSLYESDVLDENTIIDWAESPPESSWFVDRDVAIDVRKKATPFINWLKLAEEEDSD
jgi:translation initiation factor 5